MHKINYILIKIRLNAGWEQQNYEHTSQRTHIATYTNYLFVCNAQALSEGLNITLALFGKSFYAFFFFAKPKLASWLCVCECERGRVFSSGKEIARRNRNVSLNWLVCE